MPHDFKYSLTRICLKSGRLSLPLRMFELFPREGTVRAFDTNKGTEFLLHMQGPRAIAGLGEFFKTHDLDVNDQILIRLLEDGRYALTPLVRPKRPDYSKPETSRKLVDKLLSMNTPLSESEIRTLAPDLPRTVNLSELLTSDGRLVRNGGRWVPKPQAAAVNGTLLQAPNAAPEATTPPRGKREAGEVRAEEPAGKPQADKPRRATVTPYPLGVMFPGKTGLNSAEEGTDLSLHGRARELLQGFGFRVEGMSHGQLMAHAEMGRRQYAVLVHVHATDARLDWSVLMNRRRETSATYLAVCGEHRDLVRLHSPAELARATLWSWEAMTRAQELVRTVPVSPFDLEAHFQRDGMFEHGLERFEKTISKRVTERGNFSLVLARLATMKAPAVFMLEDVVSDGDLSREQALRVLELLSQAPFHMVAKVDNGEFCLRYGVAQGLLHLSEYALSLRDRLPARRTERLQAVQEIDNLLEFEKETEDLGFEKSSVV
jgi:hypothetical protein